MVNGYATRFSTFFPKKILVTVKTYIYVYIYTEKSFSEKVRDLKSYKDKYKKKVDKNKKSSWRKRENKRWNNLC